MSERLYTVRYYAGPYSGERHVVASDDDQAIAKCKAQVRRDMTLPMYADGYKVVRSEQSCECDE